MKENAEAFWIIKLRKIKVFSIYAILMSAEFIKEQLRIGDLEKLFKKHQKNGIIEVSKERGKTRCNLVFLIE